LQPETVDETGKYGTWDWCAKIICTPVPVFLDDKKKLWYNKEVNCN
jgi:hypothetical protein